MVQQQRPRVRRVWGYIRLALIVVLTIILIVGIASGDWGNVPITAIFIALLVFLEAMDRGWIQLPGSGGRGGEPPDSR